MASLSAASRGVVIQGLRVRLGKVYTQWQVAYGKRNSQKKIETAQNFFCLLETSSFMHRKYELENPRKNDAGHDSRFD